MTVELGNKKIDTLIDYTEIMSEEEFLKSNIVKEVKEAEVLVFGYKEMLVGTYKNLTIKIGYLEDLEDMDLINTDFEIVCFVEELNGDVVAKFSIIDSRKDSIKDLTYEIIKNTVYKNVHYLLK